MVDRKVIYHVADLHGSERCWRKFLNAAEFYGADILILGGDLTGKVLVPIVSRNGEYVGRVLGETRRARSAEELAKLQRVLRFNGLYPYVCDDDEYRRLEEDGSYRMTVFRRQMQDELVRWLELAEEHLGRRPGVECYVMAGNDDDWSMDGILNGFARIVNPEVDVLDVGGGALEMMSLGWTNRTPWNTAREFDEDDLELKIKELTSRVSGTRPILFNLHCPPYNSGLDRAPRLTEDLKPVQSGGEIEVVPVGAKAVRTAIEEVQPLLSLHGHIHESRGATRIGDTLCLNPGSRYSEGVLDGALITIDRGTVKSYQLVSG